MQTAPLGRTGVDVSIYCLGAMYFGSRNDRATSYRMLDRYVDAGGTFIDTANIYAWWVEGCRGGESETLLGEWLRARGHRSRLFIASKVGFQYDDVTRGLTAAQIEAECDKSLRRLGVETIDLYYAHVDDRATPQEETLAAFDRLVRGGKVRFIGASNFMAWRLAQAHALSERHGWPDYVCVQQRHTFLRPKPGASFDPQLSATDELVDYCRSNQVTLLAYSSLFSGAYQRADRPVPDEYRGADADARLAALHSVAAAHGVTPNQVILAWLVQQTPPILPVMAASTDAQMAENLAALDLTRLGILHANHFPPTTQQPNSTSHLVPARRRTMHGLMMNWQLTLDKILEHANRLYPHKRVTTMQPDGSLHRLSYGELYGRVKRLAKALVKLGVEPGDRVGTFAWNNYQHLELYYAIPGAGAVCHTLNIRLFPDQLSLHRQPRRGQDRLRRRHAAAALRKAGAAAVTQGVQHHVLFNAPREAARPRCPTRLYYEDLVDGQRRRFRVARTDENMAMGMCYTSGTTGEPKGALY
jgi:aryl-alcohol dehydrogenase-like predicted oxidoreductase